jgi:hypothetical protein
VSRDDEIVQLLSEIRDILIHIRDDPGEFPAEAMRAFYEQTADDRMRELAKVKVMLDSMSKGPEKAQ